MPSFTPPVRDEVPRSFPLGSREWRANPLGNRLMRHFTQPLRGVNVFIIDGVATETDPFTTYNADGSIAEFGWDRVDAAFWGGHGAYAVTAAQKTILEAAGYTVDA